MTDKRKGPRLERARAWSWRHSWWINVVILSKKRRRQQLRNDFPSPNIWAGKPLPPPGADWHERRRIAAQLIAFAQHGPYSERNAHLLHRLTTPVTGIWGAIR